MRIYPASHYTMGGLWVDYELMTTIPGLYCAGEANFSDHGANRLGASALMQGLADGYFVLPYTISNYLADWLNKPIPGTDHEEFRRTELAAGDRFRRFLSIGGTRSPDYFHRELGKIIWDYCGMERTAEGLEKALSEIPALYDEFSKDLRVTGDGDERQPDAREGRACRGLLRARDVDVPRRARARGELRRSLPRRAPVGGGRGQARRRELRPRRGVGVDRRSRQRRSATSSRSSTRSCTSRPGATSEPSDEPDAADLASGRSRRPRVTSRTTRSPRSATRRRSSSCSTSSTSV